MNIKLELLTNSITDIIRQNLADAEIDADKIADTNALSALSEIQRCMQNEKLEDFEVVEEIVGIFEKYGIDSGSRHDF